MAETLADLMAKSARYKTQTEALCQSPINARIAAFIATGHAAVRPTSETTIFGERPRLAVVTRDEPSLARTADNDRYARAVSLAKSLQHDAEAVALALAVAA